MAKTPNTTGFGRAPAQAFNQRRLAGNARGDISVTFQTKSIIKFLNDLTREFHGSKFNAALANANARAADEVAKGMRTRLQEEIGPRPQRTGQRLQRALVDDNNKYVAANVFQVGIEAWLNKSPAALYWRQIEEGMASWHAAVLFSAGPGFGSPQKPWFAPDGDGPRHMRLVQLSRRGGKMSGALIRIKGIEAKHYSRGGMEAFSRIDMFDLYERHLRRAGFSITKDTRGTYFKV